MVDTRTQFRVMALLVCVVNVAALLPILQTPWRGDDNWWYSSVRGQAILQQKNAIQVTMDDLVSGIRGGRWFPLQSYKVLVFYFMERVVYKTVIVLLVLLNVAVLGYFIYEISRSRWLSLLATVLSPLFFQQFRHYHDPLTSYHFVEQVEVLFIILSLVLFLWFIRGRRPVHLYGSLACYVVCLLVYEVSFPFFLLHGLIAYWQLGRGHLRKVFSLSLPFCLLATCNLAIAMAVRHIFRAHYSGIRIGMDASSCLQALAHGICAPLPLSTFLSHTQSFSPWWEHFLTCGTGEALVLSILTAILLYQTCRMCVSTGTERGGSPTRGLVIIGLGLWLLPAPLIAMSAKYQHELLRFRLGIGYMPVYISYFGIMMVATAGVDRTLRLLQDRSDRALQVGILAITIIGFLVAVVNFTNNRIDTAKMLARGSWDSLILDGAQKSGLLSAVPDGSTVICPWPIDTRTLRMNTDLTLKVVWPIYHTHSGAISSMMGAFPDDAFARFPREGDTYVFPDGEPVFFLKASSGDTLSGYAVLGRVTRLACKDKSVSGAALDRVYVYWYQPRICFSRDKVHMEVTGTYLDRVTLKNAGSFTIGQQHLEQRQTGGTGTVFELPSPENTKFFDAMSIRVLITSETSSHSLFRTGNLGE